jgi:hypothetical protein
LFPAGAFVRDIAFAFSPTQNISLVYYNDSPTRFALFSWHLAAAFYQEISLQSLPSGFLNETLQLRFCNLSIGRDSGILRASARDFRSIRSLASFDEHPLEVSLSLVVIFELYLQLFLILFQFPDLSSSNLHPVASAILLRMAEFCWSRPSIGVDNAER